MESYEVGQISRARESTIKEHAHTKIVYPIVAPSLLRVSGRKAVVGRMVFKVNN